jgi:hypothetical protein
MPATRRRGDPCHPGCADRRAHGDFEGKPCLAIEERRLPRLHAPIDCPVSRPHHPGAPRGRLRGPARPMDVRAGSDAYIGGQWDPLDPTDGIAPNRIALVARGRARPRPHPRRFSTRLKRTPSRFRVCWRDRGRVRICRRADGFGFGLGPFLPIFCCQLLK